jgi:hypothetical protein
VLNLDIGLMQINPSENKTVSPMAASPSHFGVTLWINFCLPESATFPEQKAYYPDLSFKMSVQSRITFHPKLAAK